MSRPRATPSHSAALDVLGEAVGRRAAARWRSTRRARAAPRGSRRCAPTDGSPGSAPARAAGEQPRQVGAERPPRSAWPSTARPTGASASSRAGGVSRSQATSPSWHSRSSHAGLVAAQPRRRAARAPTPPRRPRSPAAARARVSSPASPVSWVPGRDVLPAQQEAHEVLGGDRLDARRGGCAGSTSACGPAAGATPTRCSAAPAR